MTPMPTPVDQLRLFTVETVPVAEYLGAIWSWHRDPDFATAEAAAFRDLYQQAAAMGATAIIGVRVETTHELYVQPRNRFFGNGPETVSTAISRVYVGGTAVRL